jgi:hypothetical protein|tara:strand:- start:308 stop:535 length:228 start_codon:yes stop_codon:yes gene_type:complete
MIHLFSASPERETVQWGLAPDRRPAGQSLMLCRQTTPLYHRALITARPDIYLLLNELFPLVFDLSCAGVSGISLS